MHCVLRFIPVLSLALAPAAQDLIGLNFTGQAFAIDSRTGVGQLLGNTGRTGHNAMARNGRTLFAIEQAATGASATFALDIVDDATGTASRSVTLSRDIRGLAPGGSFALLGVAEASPNDQLVRIDQFNGTVTLLGTMSHGRVQALERHGNNFYAWDLTAGLVRVDFTTGATIDVNPNVGADVGIQFLTSHSDGRLLGGQNALYVIDPNTGVPTLIGSGGYSDLRGAEERFGVILPFGTSCGLLSQGGLTVTGTPSTGSTLTSQSSPHGRGRAGALMLGFSNTSVGGVPLPFNLDPLLGTQGCSLYTSLDVSIPGSTGASASLTFPLAIPPLSQGLIFHLQHVVLNGASPDISNGVTVRVRL